MSSYGGRNTNGQCHLDRKKNGLLSQYGDVLKFCKHVEGTGEFLSGPTDCNCTGLDVHTVSQKLN